MTEPTDHARARESADYRRTFTLSDEQRLQLYAAMQEGDRPGEEDSVNAFWAAVAGDMGFIWTTVDWFDAESGKFTAEVPDVVPPRDDSEALAWVKAQPEHMRSDGEPFGDFELGDMIEAWHVELATALELPCKHRWPAAGFFRAGQLMNCELCGKRGMMVDPGAAGDAMAEMSAAVPVRRSAPLDRGNERTSRQGILNHEIAQAYEAPDWNEAVIPDMVRATAPGWTYSVDWSQHPHKPPTVVLLDYEPDRPL